MNAQTECTFTQADVDAIVARAKQLGASDGLTEKQFHLQLSMYGKPHGAEVLAMTLVNGWHNKYDLIWATQALIEFLTALPAKRPRKARGAGAEAPPAGPSEEGMNFATEFAKLLPPAMKRPDGWQAKWAKVYDELIRLDGRDKATIWGVCRWARADAFWSKNFLSPVKLREPDSQGMKYFDRFLAAMKPQDSRRAVQRAGEYTTERRGDVIE